ncbi:hypothetical protein [Acinetobacter sp. ANC 4633]|uniref:hypothetical protein n=1 Tax=Acinetobacter sp. ANC 4633 TaxID=2529845 RepID=UPI00103E3BAC|nr:hypothetical protein [Acinetobacter sp. ANC 4633]
MQKGQFLTCVGSLQVFKAEHFTLSQNNTVVKMNKIQVLTIKTDFYSKIMNQATIMAWFPVALITFKVISSGSNSLSSTNLEPIKSKVIKSNNDLLSLSFFS